MCGTQAAGRFESFALLALAAALALAVGTALLAAGLIASLVDAIA